MPDTDFFEQLMDETSQETAAEEPQEPQEPQVADQLPEEPPETTEGETNDLDDEPEENGETTEPVSEDDAVTEGEEPEEDEEPGEKSEEPDTYTVKVDGVESEVTIEELRRNYQISSAAEKRLAEAKQQREQLETLALEMREDPLAFALRLYQADMKDPRLAQERLFSQAVDFVRPIIEEQALPEQERRLREQQRHLEYQRQMVDQQQREMEQRNQNASFEREKNKILSDVSAAMASTGLDEMYDQPQSKQTVQTRIIRVMYTAQEASPDQPMSAQEAAIIEKAELDREMKHLVGSLKPGDLEKVNPKAAQALRKKNLVEAKKKRASKGGKARKTSSTDSRRTDARPKTTRELFSEIEASVAD